MLNKIYFLENDKDLKSCFSTAFLKNIFAEIVVLENFNQVSQICNNDLLVLDIQTYCEQSSVFSNHKFKLFLVTDNTVDENIEKVISKNIPNCFVGMAQNLEDYFIEFLELSKKDGEFLEYFKENSKEIISFKLQDSNQINEKIDEIVSEEVFEDVFHKARQIIRLILSELLTNCFFHSPKAKELNIEDKRERLILDKEEIQLDFLHSNKKIIFRVKDNFGTLKKEMIEESLRNVVINKKNEKLGYTGGMGLYFLYTYSHQVIYNLALGKFTEIWVCIDKDRRFKDYELKNKTLFYFTQQENKND